LEALFHRCRATHLGLVELAWVDDSVPTPQVEAAFFDDVVSCVEEFLDVELGTVNSEDGAGSSVIETAIAAEPQFYFVCFDHQLRGRS